MTATPPPCSSRSWSSRRCSCSSQREAVRLKQFVGDADPLTPTEFRVELSQQGLTHNVPRTRDPTRVDDAVACQEHKQPL